MDPTPNLPAISHDVLRSVLTAAPSHLPKPREESIFGVGGRGYYENPTSDLLAFFLNPDATHDLGTLFLETFFACIPGAGLYPSSFESVSVRREEPLEDGKRIDLLIRGAGWFLTIENKIRHWLANDLVAYQAHVEGLASETDSCHFVILSPHRMEETLQSWEQVTYRDYLTALKARLSNDAPETGSSKWWLFAREFILHLENEIYPPLMNPKDLAFVDGHLKEIEDIKKLSQQYLEFIAGDLRQRLAGIPDLELCWESWGFWIDAENRAEWEFGLITPAHSGEPRFVVKIWRKLGVNEEELRISRPLAEYNFQEIDGGGNSVWTRHFDRRESATEELCRLVRASLQNGLG